MRLLIPYDVSQIVHEVGRKSLGRSAIYEISRFFYEVSWKSMRSLGTPVHKLFAANYLFDFSM